MSNKLDLTGQEYDRLTVISESEERKRPGAVTWICRCSCGNTVKVTRDELRSGNTRSCGCLKKEKVSDRFKEHGETINGRTRLYRIWMDMKQRCRDPNTNRSHIYHGRGIGVCKEWQTYNNFKQWAIENGYSDDLQIDRVDNNEGYYPGNCHWVTPQEQANNKRNNHLLTYKGETKTASEWARGRDIKYHTLLARLNKLNWSTEKSLTQEVQNGSS